jgi:predicted RNA-binding protein with PUA-like domain
MPKRATRQWLLKSEPETYSIDDLARDGRTPWDGVRNYQARNILRDEMALGDLCFFYHSSTDPTGVAGVCRVASKAYPDPTQFDPKSDYHDPGSPADDPRWWLVDVEMVEKLDTLVTLERLKKDKALDGLMVVKRGMRLSVQPVDSKHFRRILRMAKARTAL